MQCDECQLFRLRFEEALADLALALQTLESAANPTEEQIFTLVAEYANQSKREIEREIDRHQAAHARPALPARATQVRMITSGAAF